jgi:hypothetical protein
MVIDGDVIVLDGLPVSELGDIPESIGGLPGEQWDNFDYTGITEAGNYMFTGDTNGSTSEDEFICKDGVIILREGMMLDGEQLTGSIEGAYMNETGDIVFIWDIVEGTGDIEALFANDMLLLKEGDPVDVDGDMVPDPETAITNFTGISAVTIGERNRENLTRIYFTADVEFGAGGTAADLGLPEDMMLAGPEGAGLSDEDVAAIEGRDASATREVLEGAFVLIVPTAIANFLADFTVQADRDVVTVAWAVNGGTEALFRVVARQGAREWEVPYTLSDDRYVAADASGQAQPGESVVYSLFAQAAGSDWRLLKQQAVTLPAPQLATRLISASPNPFNPQTQIEFAVSRPQHVRISVFDATGRLVAVLADEPFGIGSHSVVWNGMDLTGRSVASGTYLAQLEGEGVLDTHKLMLLK